MKSVAFHNLGCKVNSYEIDVMQQMLQEKGYEIVPFEQTADIYIVNTCTVTNMADRKSRQMLHRAKQKNPRAVVVAVGCYVQTGKEAVEQDDCIDLAVGNNRKKDLVAILETFLESRENAASVYAQNAEHAEYLEQRTEMSGKVENEQSTPVSDYHDTSGKLDKTLNDTTVIDINDTYEYEEMTLKQTAEHTRAYIKIQDGCNQFCSYCVIPYARGRVRSRKAEDILAEIEGIVAAGYREIVLTGIHISSYGIDFEEEAWKQGKCVEKHRGENRGGTADVSVGSELSGNGLSRKEQAEELDADLQKTERKPLDYSGSSKLIDLVERIHQIPGLDRIRIGSLEPRIVTAEGARRLAALPKLCPHFHLSLQSGCDATLKRMNRHYTAGEYLQSVEYLRREFEEPAITTDVIVGFPGETEEEFEKTREFLDKISFFEMHIFKYSKRAGTRAAVMPNQVPEQIKTARSNALLEMERKQSVAFRSRYIGREAEILVEEKKAIGGKEYWIGHTVDYVKVAVPAEDAGQLESNMLVNVKVQRFLNDEVLVGVTVHASSI